MSRAPPPPPRPPRYVALLALCAALPAALPAALAQVITTYEQGTVGLSPQFIREVVIPNGQCSGLLNVGLVCQDRWRPVADLLRLHVSDHSVVFVKMRADLSQALVYRNDGDEAAACPGEADIKVEAHCVADPSRGPMLFARQ